MQLQLLAGGHRLLADLAGGDLDVLLLNDRDDVVRRHIERRHLLRVEPDAHAVIALAEIGDVAHAGQAEQLVLDLRGGVVGQVEVVVGAARGEQVDRQQNGRATSS